MYLLQWRGRERKKTNRADTNKWPCLRARTNIYQKAIDASPSLTLNFFPPDFLSRRFFFYGMHVCGCDFLGCYAISFIQSWSFWCGVLLSLLVVFFSHSVHSLFVRFHLMRYHCRADCLSMWNNRQTNDNLCLLLLLYLYRSTLFAFLLEVSSENLVNHFDIQWNVVIILFFELFLRLGFFFLQDIYIDL